MTRNIKTRDEHFSMSRSNIKVKVTADWLVGVATAVMIDMCRQ